MNKFILIFSFLLFISTSIVVCGQTVSVENQSNSPICNQEFFEKAEDSYNRRRKSSEISGHAERKLNKIVSSCADSFWRNQAEEYLKIVQEEQAESNFVIARYYWNKFQKGRIKSLIGVLFWLRRITENYPNYSKMDEVKQLLDAVNKENLR